MNKLSVFTGAFIATLSAGSQSAPLNLSSTPLVVAGAGADPNIMMLFDTSISMKAIVEQDPYDKSKNDFTCPSKKQLDQSNNIKLGIQKDGDVFIIDGDGEGGDKYDFRVNSNKKGITGRSQRCFNPTTKYKARLYAKTESSDKSYYYGTFASDSYYTGHYLNWYFNYTTSGRTPNFGKGASQRPSTKTRIEVAKDVGLSLVNDMSDMRVGIASFQGSQGNDPKAFGDNYVHATRGYDGAKIHVTLGDVETNRSDLIKHINTFTEDNLTGGTPLGEAFADIGRYYIQGTQNQTLTLYPDQKDSAKMKGSDLFKGVPIYYENDDKPTSKNGKNAIQYECQANFIIGLTDGDPTVDGKGANGDAEDDLSDDLIGYENGGGENELIDDVTSALYNMDLRTDLEGKNNIRSYIIGFGGGIEKTALIQRAVNLGGGQRKMAANAFELTAAFEEVFEDVKDKAATAARVAFNGVSLSGGKSQIYKVSFDATEWSGNLVALDVDADRKISSTPAWDAANLLDKKTVSTRVVYTHDGSKGITFDWSSLNGLTGPAADLNMDGYTGSADARGADRVAYLRGDRTKEGKSSTDFRKRGSVLGDIVNSAPVYVGAPSESWDEMYKSGYDGYADYKTDNESRTAMVYVGANDGMLHGFEASSGEEKVAYVPSALYNSNQSSGLHALANPNYDHQFYVDLTPTVSDVYYGSAWHTVLVGGLRGGGKGYFALDVTTPEFGLTTAGKKVLWEINESNEPHDANDLGYSYSQPIIAKMNNGKWAAIFGNGYNSNNGQAVLYIAYIGEGADGWAKTDIVKIHAGVADATNPNGLSSPTVVDTDEDGDIDRIYAGDIKGNMWVFDTSGNKPSSTATKLFSAGSSQPITMAPVIAPNGEVEKGTAPNVMVLFGTGQYLTPGDLTSTERQAFYGVWDNASKGLTRSDLTKRTLTIDEGKRTSSGGDIDWTSSHGWYVDLANAVSVDGAVVDAAERAVLKPFVHMDGIYFNTTIPNSEVCSSGGSSWMMVLDYTTGLATDYAALDTNNDGELSEEGDKDSSGKKVDGLVSESTMFDGYMWTNVTGEDEAVLDDELPAEGDVGRLGWQELIRP